MSGYQYILLDKDPKQHIATLTLNRPDRRNALNDVMQDEIGDAIEEVESDNSIRVMVLTGSGRVFCAGGDLDQLQGGSQSAGWVSENTDDIRRAFQRTQRFMLGLQRMEKRQTYFGVTMMNWRSIRKRKIQGMRIYGNGIRL